MTRKIVPLMLEKFPDLKNYWLVYSSLSESKKLIGHTKAQVFSVCFNHNGSLLASGAHDKTVRLWDPKTGAQVGYPLIGHNHDVQSVCFNHDGTLLASGSADGIRLWNPTTRTLIARFLSSYATTLCFNHDGHSTCFRIRSLECPHDTIVESTNPCSNRQSISWSYERYKLSPL